MRACPAPPPTDSVANVLRTGLIGVGKMGVSHLAIASAHPDMDVVAVCDSQAFVLSGLKSLVPVQTYRNADKMFADAGLDCVFIATPTSSHHDLTAAALDQGIHVFAEKPLTLSAAQSAALASQAEQRHLANQVGYHNRFIGTFQEVARLVRRGAIGRVHHVDGKAFGPVVTEARGGGLTWRSSKVEGGGCLHDYACHVVDLMNFVMGPPVDVSDASLTSIFSTDVEDAVHASFVYPDGATGALETNWSDESVRKMSTTITVYGTHGKIYADRQECRVYLRDGHSFEHYEPGWTIRYITELQAPVNYYLRGEEYSAQIDAFVDAVQRRDPAAQNSFTSAAQTDAVIELIARRAHGDRDGVVGTVLPVPAVGSVDLRTQFVDLARNVGQVGRERGLELRDRAMEIYARRTNR
jgi:scyllo-inositol 2-dehydrogenase (NADP+)